MADTRTYIQLHKVLPNVVPEFDLDTFQYCEREVITPALVAAGYVLTSPWYTGEGDSFGPLSRCIDTDKGTVVYS